MKGMTQRQRELAELGILGGGRGAKALPVQAALTLIPDLLEEALRAAGYTDVRHLEGDMRGWREAGASSLLEGEDEAAVGAQRPAGLGEERAAVADVGEDVGGDDRVEGVVSARREVVGAF